MKIAIIGMGEIGEATLMAMATRLKKGSDIIYGVDINDNTIRKLRRRHKGKIFGGFGKKIPAADVYILSVYTCNQVKSVLQQIHNLKLENRPLVVIESTISPQLAKKMLQMHSKDNFYDLALFPHRFNPGDVKHAVFNLNRTLGGVDEQSSIRSLKFYRKFMNGQQIIPVPYYIASMSKPVENAIRFMEIAFAEEIKMECDRLGVDFKILRKAVNSKWNIEIKEAKDGIGGKCVHPSVQIITLGGKVCISDIKKGDNVLTHKGEFKRVSQLFKRKIKEKIYEITPQGHQPITVTNEHPFLTVKANRNSYGKTGKLSNYRKNKLIPQWIEGKDLNKGDFLITPIPTFTKKCKTIKEVEVNASLMRLLGYYIAEGHSSEGRIVFAFNKKEKEYYEDVEQLLIKIFKAKSKRYIINNNCMSIRVNSVKLSQLFKYLCGGKANKKRLHQSLLFIELNLIKEFLKGYFRGDGSISTGVYSCTTISQELFNQLQICLLRLGIAYTTQITQPKERGGVNHQRVYTIRIRSYPEIKKMNEIIDDMNIIKDTKFNRKTSWVENKWLITPIKKIREIEYSGYVYNLEVEDDHSFVTIPATLHNCLPKDTEIMSKYFTESQFIKTALKVDKKYKRFVKKCL